MAAPFVSTKPLSVVLEVEAEAEAEASADVEVAIALVEDVEDTAEDIAVAEVAPTVSILNPSSHQDLTYQEGGGGGAYDRQDGGGRYDRQGGGGGGESFPSAPVLAHER